MTTPNDPFYGNQWHFNYLGDIEIIWNDYTGAGVNVGVYDDGVDYNHPDLAANYDASLHFVHNSTTYDAFPKTNGDNHGTAVAGLIGAVGNNGVGMTGVAWNVSLTGVNILGDAALWNVNRFKAALNWAVNFDIMNNSWGYPSFDQWGNFQGYDPDFSTLPGTTLSANEGTSYAMLSATGRGGLGTIIVQAAGNDGIDANVEGLNALRYTLTVAATSSNGVAAWYSNYGSSILIAAPAGAYTTDITGTGNFNTHYMNNFGGTSAATPVTSGVVALMLEANPNLGWRDVQNILAMSAAQTGGALGGASLTNEQGTWAANGAGNWNGGGVSYNASYGYGMLNAFNAVRMAEVWGILHAQTAMTSANEQSFTQGMNAGNFTWGSGGNTRTVTIDVGQNIRIESIAVHLDITYNWAADLELWLIAPDGSEYMLHVRQGDDSTMDNGLEWVFGVEHARGTVSAGEWTLRIHDSEGLVAGSLDHFEMTFYGSAVGQPTVHHFTDDFLTLANWQSDRTTISAITANDWLNFAAVAGDVEISIANGTIMVNGVAWATLEDVFRKIMLGDGDDVIMTGDVNSIVHGMRGDDIIIGGVGNDFLSGGDGNDTLAGGGGNDWLVGGAGNDHLSVTSGNNLLNGQTGDDTLIGGTGDDRLWGGQGDDILDASAGGNNVLKGGTGNDTLIGGAGDDWLNGGAGNDSLTGGAGADTFVFTGAAGHNTITDYEYGIDTILFGANLSPGDLSFGVVGSDAVITINVNTTITILNGAGQDYQDDFVFV